MKILLTGSTGFVGGRLLRQLLDAGHSVVCAGRSEPVLVHARCSWLALDYPSTSSAAWLEHLRGVDAVVNLVGIFRETATATFDALHVRGPTALFDACAEAGVRRVVQVSALGADQGATSRFHSSKYSADVHLLSLPLDACVAMPSLVFGLDGSSSQQLLKLAALPLLLLPAGGGQALQPVHVDEAVEALRRMVEAPEGLLRGKRLALVGPQPVSLCNYLLGLRSALGLTVRPARLSLPAWLMRTLARVGDHWPGALFDSAAWAMLQRGNTADVTPLVDLLGRRPRPVAEFIRPQERAAARSAAQLGGLLPMLRASLSFVWLYTAYVSLAVYPREQSYALLERTGVPPALQAPALWGAAALDLVFGLLTLFAFAGRRWLWVAQAALIVVYTALISWRMPEFWAHPYGPLSKNLPMLALLVLLWSLEPQPAGKRRNGGWTT